eukprot:scaffold1044_cov266-Pinguiococcus_pyrenoidosus.AAC.12
MELSHPLPVTFKPSPDRKRPMAPGEDAPLRATKRPKRSPRREAERDLFLDANTLDKAVRHSVKVIMGKDSDVNPALLRKMRTSVAAIGFAMRHPGSTLPICKEARRLVQTAKLHEVTPHSKGKECFGCQVWKSITHAVRLVHVENRKSKALKK